jgi:hypothetical protein
MMSSPALPGTVLLASTQMVFQCCVESSATVSGVEVAFQVALLLRTFVQVEPLFSE